MNVVTMALGIDVTYMITNILGHSFCFAYCKVKKKKTRRWKGLVLCSPTIRYGSVGNTVPSIYMYKCIHKIACVLQTMNQWRLKMLKLPCLPVLSSNLSRQSVSWQHTLLHISILFGLVKWSTNNVTQCKQVVTVMRIP